MSYPEGWQRDPNIKIRDQEARIEELERRVMSLEALNNKWCDASNIDLGNMQKRYDKTK